MRVLRMGVSGGTGDDVSATAQDGSKISLAVSQGPPSENDEHAAYYEARRYSLF
jgi:hypothetical protein